MGGTVAPRRSSSRMRRRSPPPCDDDPEVIARTVADAQPTTISPITGSTGRIGPPGSRGGRGSFPGRCSGGDSPMFPWNYKHPGVHGDVDDLDELLAPASVTFAATLSARRLVNFSF